MPAPPRSSLLLLAFVTVSIAWGTTYAAISVAVRSIPPFSLAAMRFLLAGAIMMGLAAGMRLGWPTRRDWAKLAVVGVLLLSVGNALLAYAEQYVSSGFAALVVNCGPFIYVALCAAAGEKVPRMAWAGLGVGFLGLTVLLSPQLRSLGAAGAPDRTFWFAMAALVVGPFAWSLGSFIASKRPARCHPFLIAGGQTLVGGLGGLIIALLRGERFSPAAVPAEAWWALAWLVGVGSLLGYVSYMYVVMYMAAHRTATVTYLNNLVAVLVGWLVLDEHVTAPMIVGGAVVLLGVGIVNRAKSEGRGGTGGEQKELPAGGRKEQMPGTTDQKSK